MLYGTTYSGGGNGCFKPGCGTVFKITTSGAENVVYRFAGGSDGDDPLASVTNVNGVLYGTTSGGGANNAGTVYKITTLGNETVLHSFGSVSDGEAPYAALIDVNGVLYGTTDLGGSGCSSPGCGTVFTITTAGAESVLHSFAGGSDGQSPFSVLTDVNGVLYGTTTVGGANGDNGTVFKVTRAGAESVVYSFAASDGAQPVAGLVNVHGVLYGTTSEGGASGDGTVFSLTL